MKCNICGTQNKTNFYPSKPSRCMDCLSKVSAGYYSAHKDKIKQKQLDRTLSFQDFIDGYKLNSCADCLRTYPSICMEFDHTDLTQRSFDMIDALSGKYSKEMIYNEIQKCQLVCANCYRLRVRARQDIAKKKYSKAQPVETRRNNMKISGNTINFGDFSITFHRTLRLPEDGRVHNLPPSLGSFPIKRVEDYLDKVPSSWIAHGGVFIPMFQKEALWMSFNSINNKHHAIKVAAGKVNAVNGKPWSIELKPPTNVHGKDPEQDYMVSPGQPWLDGFNTGDDIIRQFVAMPLGQGYTVEGQVTGKEEFGGLQLLVMPAKSGAIPQPTIPDFLRGGNNALWSSLYTSNPTPASTETFITWTGGTITSTVGGFGSASTGTSVYYTNNVNTDSFTLNDCFVSSPASQKSCNTRSRSEAVEMGLAQGGKMKQKIYADPYGIHVWDQAAAQKVFVHIVNSEMYYKITGEYPPASPITADTYRFYNYPWYKIYDETVPSVEGSGTLAGVKPVSQIDAEKGIIDNTAPYHESNVKVIYNAPPQSIDKHIIKDGKW